jgi:hypothetical protein
VLAEKRWEEFFDFLHSEPRHKQDIPLLEIPVVLDIESSTVQQIKEIYNNIKPMEIDDQGLTSLLDDIVQPECRKILAEMEPGQVPLKWKSVSFVV